MGFVAHFVGHYTLLQNCYTLIFGVLCKKIAALLVHMQWEQGGAKKKSKDHLIGIKPIMVRQELT